MTDRVNEFDLPLPPRRPLPPEVRGRVRATVFRELDAPARTRLNRIRPPLAVAASVAVLAAGAMIVTQSVDGAGHDPLVPPPTASATPEPPPLDPVAAQANMDRCAAAIQGAGKTASVPDRATWVPVFALPDQGRTVTALRAAGMPLFCETTRTTVTVSNPDVAPGFARGSATAALLISKNGAMAGIADPAWQSMVVSTDGGSSGEPAIIKDGLWVRFSTMTIRQDARFTVRRTIPGHPEERNPVDPGGVSIEARPGVVRPGQSHPELDLPRPPEPLVSVVDKPSPPADRTSDMGRFLGECIAKTSEIVVDPDVWEPIAIVGSAPYRAVLARFGDEVVACAAAGHQTDPGDLSRWETIYGFVPPSQARTIRPAEPIQYFTVLEIGRRDSGALLGLVRPDVASLELLADGREPLPVPVADGAFAVSYPIEPVAGPDRPSFTVVARSSSGVEIHRGPLSDFY